MSNLLIKKDGYKKPTTDTEVEELLKRQEVLRMRRDFLFQRRTQLYDNIRAANNAEDSKTAELARKELDVVQEELLALDAEYKVNSTAQEEYTRSNKNKLEGRAAVGNMLQSILMLGGGLWLGTKSLRQAFQYDNGEAPMNKQTWSIFQKINPINWFSNIRKK